MHSIYTNSKNAHAHSYAYLEAHLLSSRILCYISDRTYVKKCCKTHRLYILKLPKEEQFIQSWYITNLLSIGLHWWMPQLPRSVLCHDMTLKYKEEDFATYLPVTFIHNPRDLNLFSPHSPRFSSLFRSYTYVFSSLSFLFPVSSNQDSFFSTYTIQFTDPCIRSC